MSVNVRHSSGCPPRIKTNKHPPLLSPLLWPFSLMLFSISSPVFSKTSVLKHLILSLCIYKYVCTYIYTHILCIYMCACVYIQILHIYQIFPLASRSRLFFSSCKFHKNDFSDPRLCLLGFVSLSVYGDNQFPRYQDCAWYRLPGSREPIPTKGRLAGGVPGAEYVGDVGELEAASAEVVLDLDSGGSVRRGRPGGGGGASIWEEM